MNYLNLLQEIKYMTNSSENLFEVPIAILLKHIIDKRIMRHRVNSFSSVEFSFYFLH